MQGYTKRYIVTGNQKPFAPLSLFTQYTVFFIRIGKFCLSLVNLAKLGDSASNDSKRIINEISKLGYTGIQKYGV